MIRRHVAAIQTLNYSESLPALCASIPQHVIGDITIQALIDLVKIVSREIISTAAGFDFELVPGTTPK